MRYTSPPCRRAAWNTVVASRARSCSRTGGGCGPSRMPPTCWSTCSAASTRDRAHLTTRSNSLIRAAITGERDDNEAATDALERVLREGRLL